MAQSLFDRYRQQQFWSTLQNAGDSLLAMAGARIAPSPPGPSLLEFAKLDELQRSQRQEANQQSARSTLLGGLDPRSGITWTQPRQGMPESEKLGLLGQAYPEATGKALLARALPKPPEVPSGFESTPTGLRPIPGGPADIGYLAQKAEETRAPDKPPTSYQEWQLARKDGSFTGTYADWKKLNKAETNISLGRQETEEQKARGKSLVAQYEAVNERATSAEDAINQLSIAKAVAATSELPSQLKSTAGNMAVALGIPLPAGLSESITSGQAFTGVMQNLVLTKMQAQKGPQTENDAKRIQATLANLGNTPEARGFLMEVGINLARRDVMERDFWETWYANEGTYDGAARAWNKHIGGVPLVGFNEQAPDLPIFYPEFETIMREDRPDITEQEILRLWKKYYGGG